MKSNNYLAIDLGASSGRLIVAHENNFDEVHRFSSYLKRENDHLVWDIDYIFHNIIIGLKKAIKKYKRIRSLSIDAWGVDYVLLNGNKTIKPCFAYRDQRTIKTSLEVHKIIPFNDLYQLTGIQFAQFNTIYQLKDDLNSGRLEKATDFLHIPEYLTYLLTGKKVKEYTMASTTGLLNLKTGTYDQKIISKLQYPKKLFKTLVKPGFVVGNLKSEIVKEIGGDIKVVMCATHDTASAFESVMTDNKTIILSSGTWSLIGVKLKKGNNSLASRKSNFTNEGGVKYMRYLKNIMGMWIFNEVSKKQKYTYDQINIMVEASKYQEIFDVNDPSLLSPKDMKTALLLLLSKNPPKNDGDLYRSIYRSLAFSYLKANKELNKNLNKKFTKICIVGGGAKNTTLNKIIEAITKLKVLAIPIEATAIGNIKIQKQV